MFIMSLIAKLEVIQVDYTNDFAQATLSEDIYIPIPTGFEKPGYVLKLMQSIYGLVQAPCTFYEFLSGNLKRVGFRNKKNIDPFLWIHNKHQIMSVCVDGCLFNSKSTKINMEIINNIQKIMPLTISDQVTAFLGVKIKQDWEKYVLTQPGPIKNIINLLRLQDGNSVHTPALPKPLGSDINGKTFTESWGYSSAVGMLLYLANNTRPDIAFAVRQFARFTHAPRHIHAQGLKRIWYLLGTSDKGMILSPSDDFSVDCYVDANFASLYSVEDSQYPICAKPWSGYI
jgi:hypothetical protein